MNEFLMIFFLNYLQALDKEKKSFRRGINFEIFFIKPKETMKVKKRNYHTDTFTKCEHSQELIAHSIQDKKETLYDIFIFHYIDRWALVLAKPNIKSYYIKYFGTKEENVDFKYSLDV
jgi:hypothetical protein